MFHVVTTVIVFLLGFLDFGVQSLGLLGFRI